MFFDRDETMFRRTENLFSCQSDLARIRERRVGGKAWNLFRLRALGYEMPCWCVVSSRVFETTRKPHAGSIKRILAGIDFTDQAALEEGASRIGELVLHSRFPGRFSEELDQMLEEAFSEQTFFSVRSSVVGEDSAEHSFAGQMDSFLHVPRARIPEAIRKVWASAYSGRALVYRKRKGMSLTDVSSAVIVQEMVGAVAAGVLFTRDPETRAKTSVISAGYGLGEGIVANKVSSDTYRMDRDGNVISREVTVKDHRIVSNGQEGGTRLDPVPSEMRTREVLTRVQLEQLQEISLEAESRFGAPQDIEWAFDGAGRLFILQTRPIVFTRGAARAPRSRIWDNSNIVESYPGLTLPLTFSFARGAYESTFRNAALGFLLFRRPVKKRLDIFKNMIGLLDGRVYYNLLNWYEMLSYLPGSKQHRESWDQMIGVTRKIDSPLERLAPINRLYAGFKASWKLLTVERTARKFFAGFEPVYAGVEGLDFSAATESDLAETYESFTRELAEHWHLTLDNDFSAMTYYNALEKLCERWGLNGYPNVHNDLLCGEPAIESVAPVRSLVRLAELFQSDRAYRELISENDDTSAWSEIESNAGYAPLKTALETHLKLFGDRSLEELKLEAPSFRQHPESVIGLVRNYLRLRVSVEDMERREQDIRGRAEQFVRQNLKNPLQRLFIRFVLRNARTAIASRENMRFARSRVFGVIKRLFQRIGEIFVARGLLDAASDVHYLTVEEILGFVQGAAVTQDLRALVKIRQADYAAFALRTPAERIETVGIPYGGFIAETYSPEEGTNCARGIGCSSGVAKGEARVILDPQAHMRSEERILVAKSTDPAWVFLMVSARGIVVEKGSVLSHTAIIGRELGIPTIVGVKDATRRIPDGAELSINGSTGEAWWQ